MKHIYSLERLKQSVINFLEHVVVPTLTIFYRIIEYIFANSTIFQRCYILLPVYMERRWRHSELEYVQLVAGARL